MIDPGVYYFILAIVLAVIFAIITHSTFGFIGGFFGGYAIALFNEIRKANG